MSFYTRIPFAFWLSVIFMAALTWAAFQINAPWPNALTTFLCLYWGVTIAIIGLAFSGRNS